MTFKRIFLFVSFLAIFGFLFCFDTSSAKAATVEELQAQIQALLQQINQLQQQLTETQGTTTTAWCHDFNINLRIGDKSSEITQLKQALIKDGSMSYMALATEEEFDEETAAAVVEFQEKYKDEVLTPYKLKRGTGFIGKSTRAKLNQLFGCVVTPTPTTPSITVISPNGGERWEMGKTYQIQWESQGIDKVDIRVRNVSDSPVGVLIANGVAGGLGVYSWTISAASFSPRDDYEVGISGVVEGKVIGDQSDNNFSIVAATTTTPLTCTDLQAAPASASYFNLCKDQGFDKVCFNKYNYEYQGCGKLSRDDCTLYNVNASQNIWCDTGLVSTPTSYITIVSPNGGEKWQIGKTYEISWTMSGVKSDTPIKIFATNNESNVFESSAKCTTLATGEYVSTSGYGYKAIFCGTVAYFTSGNYKYSFTIPSTWPAGSKYKINVAVPGASDSSDNYFSIISEAITSILDIDIISPKTGENITAGSKVNIQWQAQGIDYSNAEGFQAYYLYQGSTVWNFIGATSISTSNSYLWTVPNTTGKVNIWIGAVKAGKWVYQKSVDGINIISGTVITPSITVISPNGGEQWQIGSTYQLKWTSNNLPVEAQNKVSISLMPEGLSNGTAIFSNITNDGSEGWTIPATVYPGRYKIDVGCYIAESGCTHDASDNYFSIVAASLTCSWPNGCCNTNADCPASAPYCVKSAATEGPKIGMGVCDPGNAGHYCDKSDGNADCMSGYNCNTNCADYNNLSWCSPMYSNGSISWPGYTTGSNIRCASCYEENNICKTKPSTPSITVLSPNGGEKWEVGKTYDITWSSFGVDYVNIELGWSTGGIGLASNISASPGKFSWKVDTWGNQNYRIKIYSSTQPAISDQSDNYFSIVSATTTPSITVTSPNGGEKWVAKGAYSVKWLSSNIPSSASIVIEIQRGGVVTNPIKQYIEPNDGSLDIEALNLPVGDDYKVNIYYGEAAEDFSDNYFSIVSAITACTDSDNGQNYYTKGKSTGIYAGSSNATGGWVFGEDANKASSRYDPTLNYSIYYDHCFNSASSKQLNEGYCANDGKMSAIGITCPYGCKDGACLTQAATTCSDTDWFGSDNANHLKRLATKGTCTDSAGTRTDFCVDSNALQDYTCEPLLQDPKSCGYTTYYCTAYGFDGCQDGACRLNQPALVSPSNELTVSNLTPILDWSDVTGAAVWRLTLELKDIRYIYDNKLITGSSQWAIPSGTLEYGKTYLWSVTACADETFTNCRGSAAEWRFNTPTNPSITVISPNGGEILQEGTDYKITWSAFDIPSDAKIYITLFRSDGQNMPIISNLPSTQREYAWRVTGSGDWGLGYESKSSFLAKIFGVKEVEAAGTGYQIMVSTMWGTYGTNYYGNVYDKSDYWFNIAAPYITVISPNGGETWEVGKTYDIVWSSFGVNYVGIELSWVTGATGGGIGLTSSVLASSGKFSWKVDTWGNTSYKVRIYNADQPIVSDSSDNYFSIIEAPTVIKNTENQLADILRAASELSSRIKELLK